MDGVTQQTNGAVDKTVGKQVVSDSGVAPPVSRHTPGGAPVPQYRLSIGDEELPRGICRGLELND